ncbi:MAG: MmcQ/YjbR family DNA-binding protein [Chloroflexota bacterium]
MAQRRALRKRLIQYALGLPEAYLDHPWGEDVAKVRKKVFVFFGMPEGTDFGMGVKLPQSAPLALAQPGVTPSGYGLGDSGWVSIRFGEASLPYEMLRDWIDESYRAVAPKKLGASLR